MKTKSIFLKPIFNSRVKSANVKINETLFGYLLGPFLALIVNAVFTGFINLFYTDVLGMTGKSYGVFLTILPLVSTIFVALGNIAMGLIIDKTKTSQGKARPYLLLAAPLLVVSCILIFLVPQFGAFGKIIWVSITYNLFFAIAYPIYFMSHSMLVPLSTRNIKQRNGLSVVSNMANLGAAGMFAAIIFPMFLPFLGVNQNKWLLVMGILGTLACLGSLLEYYFTRERISEEGAFYDMSEVKVPYKKQLKGVVMDKYWWIIIIFYLLFQLGGSLKNISMVYYCNYIVGSYQDGITQTVLALLSGLPMAIGIVFIWPLANKFGKKNVTIIGMIISVVGSLIAISSPYNLTIVVIGIAIKGIGTIPACYVMMALFADVLDHLEHKNGFRCDGLSMSLYSIITVAALGICTGIFNALLSSSGYVPPINEIAQVQSKATEMVLIICFIGVELVSYAVIAILLMFINVEKNIKVKQAEIVERQKQAVLESGKEWIEPKERERIEQERQDNESETARQIELQNYCRKKGLDYEKEEARYLEKKEQKRKKKTK